MQARNRIILSPFFLDQPLPELPLHYPDSDQTNVPPLVGEDVSSRLASYHQPLADRVLETLETGVRPVSVCGDCCAVIPVLAGLQRAGLAPTLIWFDAHGDFNTPETSPSGFLGGMPLAMIVGRGDQALLRAVNLAPVAENRVFLCDARDLDATEAVALKASAVNHIRDIDTLIAALPAKGPWHVHFDCDVISSDEAPAQNYPAASGPSSAQVAQVFRKLGKTGRVVSTSLSSWNPALDKDRATARVVTRVFDALIGGKQSVTGEP